MSPDGSAATLTARSRPRVPLVHSTAVTEVDDRGELTEDQQRALDAVAERVLTRAQDHWIQGRWLRRAMGSGDKESKIATLTSLVPLYLQGVRAYPEDAYRLTFAGVMHSKFRDQFDTYARAVLRYIKRRFDEDPEFENYTWEELKAGVSIGGAPITNQDFPMVNAAISMCRLLRGATTQCGPDFKEVRAKYGAPIDVIEELDGVETAADLLQLWQSIDEREARKAPQAPPAQAPPIPGGAPTSNAVSPLSTLHERIRDASEALFLDGHLQEAVAAAFKALNQYVRERANRADDGGVGMMHAVFSDTPNSDGSSRLLMNDLSDQTQRDEQMGFRFMFAGAQAAVRNVAAHDDLAISSAEEAIEYLGLASLLARRVEIAVVSEDDIVANDHT